MESRGQTAKGEAELLPPTLVGPGHMESFLGDTEESTEDIPGRKKSKLKSLRSRLFGRSKKAGEEGNSKLSQSASDITAGKTLGSDEDLVCSQGVMGSRALSHDSIFLADQALTDVEPARVLSQENVHSKIKALQEKLQQQKLHLGFPPPLLPMRRPEDPGSRSEDDSLPHSPSEVSAGHVATQGGLNKALSQLGSHPLPPFPKPAPTKSVSPTVPILSNSPPVVEPPLDFSCPAQFTPCLDTSAARHRMSVKPRNQRASTKKRLPGSDSGSSLHNLNNTESLTEEEQQLQTQAEETLETERGGSDIPFTSRGPSKFQEPASAPSETAPKASSLGFSQQDSALPVKALPLSSQVLRNKPHKSVDVIRPHSSYVQSDLMEKIESTRDFDIQIMTPDKRDTQNKGGATDFKSKMDQFSSSSGSGLTFRSSGVQGETENTRGIKRPAPGSGSFHFSITTAKNRDAERPRSGSFVGVLENTGAQLKTGEGKEDTSPSIKREKEDIKDLRPRGGPADVGRLRQEGALHKSPVLPWDRDSLKKVESVTQSKNITTDTGAVDREELEGSQEAVEEAVEVKEVHEEEGKTAFGVKLRSTSQSVRLRSEVSSYQQPKSKEEPSEKQRQEISTNASFMAKKQPVNVSCVASTAGDARPTDGSTAPSAVSFPLKHNLQPTAVSHVPPTEVKTEVEAAPQAPQEPPPVPQTAAPEVSWMSLAMEKTRSLQSLFTSRFPRDFTGVQTAARPQTQTTNQAQTETQTPKSTTPLYAASQPSTDAVKAETPKNKTQEQTVKPSPMPKVSPVESNTSKEAPKQTEPQFQPNVTESAPQANTWTSPSPLRSTHQTETASQFAQSGLSSSQHPASQHGVAWSNRSLHSTNQLKSTPSASSAPPAPSSVTTSVGEESAADAQEKDGQPPPSGRRTVWGGSVSQKAAFLEKRTASPGAKGVEGKKTQTEVQSTGETSAQTTTVLTKDTKPEGSQGVKQAESSPAKVPEKPREEKWLRKNMAPSSSPSSSPTLPSALSDSGQPSWMELAKRKSMAWSDKTMD